MLASRAGAKYLEVRLCCSVRMAGVGKKTRTHGGATSLLHTE